MRSRRARNLVAGAAALLTALAAPLLALGPAAAGPDVNPPGSAALANEITNKFVAYGNVTGYDHWTGGDGLEAIELPDGRVLWFFNDYYRGTVNADLTRDPFQATMPRNGIVIQNADGTMGTTNAGPQGTTLVTTDPGSWLWGGDQRLQGSSVQKFYMHMSGGGWGTADGVELKTIPFGSVGNAATYGSVTLPAKVSSCAQQAGTGCTLWGMGLADDGDTTYIYGSHVTGGTKQLRIAKVPTGDFGVDAEGHHHWKFWTGSTWSSDPDDAADTGSVASEALSVTYQAGRWVLITQDTYGGLGGNVISYYSDTPWGFTSAAKSTLYKMPETTADWGIWAYTPRLIKHLSTTGNQVVIGYSVNSQLKDAACGEQAYIDARIYRPRFKALTLPATPGGSYQAPDGPTPAATWLMPGSRPGWCDQGTAAVPAPTGVTATPSATNNALTFAWSQSPSSATWSYGFQFRAAGDAWGTEWPMFVPDSRSWTGSLLTPARTYEFRVRASTWEGGSSAWTTKSVTMPIDPPTGLAVTRTSATRCTLSITDPQAGVGWYVQQQKVGTSTWTTAGPFLTKTPYFTIASGVKYDYRVRSYSDYGTSGYTAVKRCGL